MILLLRTKRPSGSCGQLRLAVRITTDGGLHLQTAQKIIQFIQEEIRHMDAEESGVEYKPNVEREFGRLKSSWPKRE